MNIFIKHFINKTEIKDLDKLKEYVNFCINNSSEKEYNEIHHILPKSNSCFPEFKDLKVYDWNSAYLSYEHHFIAHKLLVEAVNNVDITYAFIMMSNKMTNFESETYMKEKIKANQSMSERMKNTVYCYNIINKKTVSMSVDEYKNRDKSIFIHHNTGRKATQKTLDSFKIRTVEYQYAERMSKNTKGMVVVLDTKNNKIKQVSSQEYHSTDHYIFANAHKGKDNGMFGKKRTDKEKNAVSKANKGKIPVIDNEGNKKSVLKTSTEWINKEVISITKVRQYKKYLINTSTYKCPYCEEEGNNNIFFRTHFEHCLDAKGNI